jgi:RP/EB family microtubule-associated protein
MQFEEFLKDLEGDLKVKMEYNWKLMYAIEDMLYQRSTLYNILTQIEGISQKNQDSEFKETLINIVTYTPNDFKQEEDLKLN